MNQTIMVHFFRATKTLVVKLPYKFEKRQLPIFFYNKNEIFPDSTFLKDDMEETYYLCKKQKINNIIIQIKCCFLRMKLIRMLL